jgi:outer membrane protein assembly factor BamD (BamD/ComL family)
MKLAALLVLSAMSTAPFQCASDPDPNKRREETPGEALYGLAEQFQKGGDREAQVRTLEYLVKRYPSSREAEMAKVDLKGLGVAVTEDAPAEAASAPPPAAAPVSASASSPAE